MAKKLSCGFGHKRDIGFKIKNGLVVHCKPERLFGYATATSAAGKKKRKKEG